MTDGGPEAKPRDLTPMTAKEWNERGQNRVDAAGRTIPNLLTGMEAERVRLALEERERYAKTVDLLKECLAVLTDPGVMDVDEWKHWKRRVEEDVRSMVEVREKP